MNIVWRHVILDFHSPINGQTLSSVRVTILEIRNESFKLIGFLLLFMSAEFILHLRSRRDLLQSEFLDSRSLRTHVIIMAIQLDLDGSCLCSCVHLINNICIKYCLY